MADQLPPIAWEQAVFVCLFIVLVAALLTWMDRQMQRNRASAEEQQRTWQSFITRENERWQEFLRQERITYGNARKEDRDKIDELAQGLARLTDLMGQFRQDFNIHVADESARLDVLMTDAQKTRARKRQDGSG